MGVVCVYWRRRPPRQGAAPSETTVQLFRPLSVRAYLPYFSSCFSPHAKVLRKAVMQALKQDWRLRCPTPDPPPPPPPPPPHHAPYGVYVSFVYRIMHSSSSARYEDRHYIDVTCTRISQWALSMQGRSENPTRLVQSPILNIIMMVVGGG
jgi:hypothetical protein